MQSFLRRGQGQILLWVQPQSGVSSCLVQKQELRIKPRFLSTTPVHHQPLLLSSLFSPLRHQCCSPTPCRCYSTSTASAASGEATKKRKGLLKFREPRVHNIPIEFAKPDENVDMEAAKTEKIFRDIKELDNGDIARVIIGDEIEPLLPKEPKVSSPDASDPYKHLGEADPFTVNPELVPLEMRWAILELQEEYKRLMPFHEEFKNSKVFDKFNDEVEARINELSEAWMNDPEPPNKRNVAERQAAQDRIYDEIWDKHIQTALDDPENEAELMSMKYVQATMPQLVAAMENMPSVVREVLKDEEDPFQPKMTHQIHKQISDTLLKH